eukprot:3740561-Pleurochrysis_carterae.AAC.2
MATGTACPPAALPRAWRGVRHKRASDALDFREGRLIELDVGEADCSEPVDVEQIDEVATAALVDAEVALQKACGTCQREVACRSSSRRASYVRDGRGASGDKGVVDGHDLVDSPRPEPLAH